MIFSRTSRYAFRALAYMASQPAEAVLDIKKISKAVRAPVAYLAKIFQGLTGAGIVISQRGQGGGYLLAREPKAINLLQILDATDDAKNSVLSNCVMGLDECNDTNPCTLHDIWVKAAKKMKEELTGTTLRDVSGLMKELRPSNKSKRILSKQIRAVFG